MPASRGYEKETVINTIRWIITSPKEEVLRYDTEFVCQSVRLSDCQYDHTKTVRWI